MAQNTSISLGDYFKNFIAKKVSLGRFINASEVIKAGLRLLEEEENKIIALKAAIETGTESGLATNFNATTHLENLKSAKPKNGQVHSH